MRKSLTAIIVVIAALATAASALAVYTQHVNVAFTTHKAMTSTGMKSSMFSTVGSTDQLKSAKTVVMTFPAKTRFNLGTRLVKRCKLTDKQLTSTTAPKSCPKASRIGAGSGTINVGPTVGTGTQLPFTVKAFVRNASTMILVVDASGQRQVIHALARHQKLTITVPQTTMGGIPLIMNSLKLNVAKRGTGKKALITAGRCVNKHFAIKTLFKYSDGTSESITNTSRCSK